MAEARDIELEFSKLSDARIDFGRRTVEPTTLDASVRMRRCVAREEDPPIAGEQE